MVALVCRNNKSTRYAAPLQSLKHQFQLYLSDMLREAWRHYVLKIRRPRLSREERLRRSREYANAITPENKHELVDWGEPRGNEIW